MHSRKQSDLKIFWQHSCKILVPICWILGLILGFCFGGSAGDSFLLMMRDLDQMIVSIPGLLFVTILPFLLTAVAVFLFQPWLLYLLIFGKSFCFGFCICGMMTVFPSVFWMGQLLLMFTDSCSLPFLMWLWLRHSDFSPKQFAGRYLFCMLASLTLMAMDYCVISPFVTTLL